MQTFILCKDWQAYTKKMKSEDKAELLDAIFAYQNGQEVGELSYAVSLVFEHITDFFQRTESEYQKKCEKQRENANKRRNKKSKQKKKSDEKPSTTPLPKKELKDGELLEVVEYFIAQKEEYHQIQHQIEKEGKQEYTEKEYKEAQKLIKEIGSLDNFKAILKFCLFDDFWKNQILSIKKLRKKNKDKIPYYKVLIDKIKTYKPPPIKNKVVEIPGV